MGRKLRIAEPMVLAAAALLFIRGLGSDPAPASIRNEPTELGKDFDGPSALGPVAPREGSARTRAAIPPSPGPTDPESSSREDASVLDIVVSVVDHASGDPVPGARVRIHADRGSQLGSALSDDSGHVTFESVPHGADLRLTATAKGYSPRDWDFGTPSDAGGPPLELSMRLVRSVVLAGTVIDSLTGTPVPGARLSVSSDGRGRGFDCDDQGEFRVEDFVAEDTGELEIRVSAKGYASIERHVARDDRGKPIRVRVPTLATLRARAIDSRGDSVPGATIQAPIAPRRIPATAPEALRPWLDEGWIPCHGDLQRGSSIRRPALELESIPHDVLEGLEVAAPGYASAPLPQVELGRPGSVTSVEVVLEPSPTYSGGFGQIRGVLSVDGEPTKGQVLWRSEFGGGRVDTELNGEFMITDVPEGPVRLEGRPRSIGPAGSPTEFPNGIAGVFPETTLHLVADLTCDADVDVHMDLRPIRGHVTSQGGEPLAGKKVFVQRLRTPLSTPARIGSGFAKSYTGTTGEFELWIPSQWWPLRLLLFHAGERHMTELRVPSGETLGFELIETRAIEIHVENPLRNRLAQLGMVHVRSEGSEDFRIYSRASAMDLDDRTRLAPGTPVSIELPLGTHDILLGSPDRFPILLESVRVESGEDPLELHTASPRLYRATISIAQDLDPLPPDLTVLLLEEEHWDTVKDPTAIGDGSAPYPATTAAAARSLNFSRNRTSTRKSLLPGRYRFKVFPPDITIEPQWIEMGLGDQRIEIRWN